MRVVRDTGIGISADKQGTIFDSFTQAHVGDPRNFGGTGLGLAIVQRLVRAMEGDVAVTSAVGEGTTFTFTAMLEPAAAAAGADAGADATVRLDGIRALVIDANATSARVTAEMLRGAGALVVSTATVARAEAPPGAAFDVVVWNAVAPAGGSAATIPDVPAGVPVIALVGVREVGNPLHAGSGAVRLAKPVKQGALVEQVDRVCRRFLRPIMRGQVTVQA